ncbi:MAG TPA: FxsA family protein [Acidimicrobiales bacterium]|nr:FxsA family protein [Acidimicrobiales bacterium]
MVGLLFLAFLVVPFLELFVILKVGGAIGALNTIGLLIVVSVVGAWLVKREGLSVLRRAQARVQSGGIPAKELVDGVLILFAGALLLTPGFLTDVVAVLLLLPPVRAGLRASTTNALARRAGRGRIGTGRFR